MSQPQLIPLAAGIGARYESLTVDAKLVNAFAEKGQQEGEIHVYKRPAFVRSTDMGAAAGLGVFYWRGDFYSVFGATLYKNGGSLTGTLDTSAAYAFTATLGTSPLLILCNGAKMYSVSTTGTISDVTGSANFPTGILADVVYLDGTIYVFQIATSRIYGSGIDDPTSWNALNYVSAAIEPDAPKALHKQLSYIIAIKEFYSEVFYDAGNPTGSPLSPVKGAKINFGTVDGRTVCECGGDVAWVARTREGGVTVVLVSSLKVHAISTPPIERLLQAADYSGAVYSWSVKVDGHRLYGVTVVNSNLTLVYDLTSGMWYQWTSPDGGYLPFSAASIGTANKVVFQHAHDGDLYSLDLSATADVEDGVFAVDIYTPNFDGGTRREKTLSRLNLIGDQAAGSTWSIWWSDDDYQTWQGPVTVDLSGDNPFVADLGSFRKRAFHLRLDANAHGRLRAVEAYLALGAL